MTYTPTYCEATHPKSHNGCYNPYNHDGLHRGYPPFNGDNDDAFFWGDGEVPAPEVPAGSAALVLTDAELGILLTTLQPVVQFFPDLNLKIIAARNAVGK